MVTIYQNTVKSFCLDTPYNDMSLAMVKDFS